MDLQIDRGIGLHGRLWQDDCAGCHPEHAGVDFELISWEEGARSRFDHAKTGWGLDGAHADLRCYQCHRQEFQQDPLKSLIRRKDPGESWLALERDCLTCHEDVHSGELGRDCRSCHDPHAWAPATAFDHALTEFPLTGRHEDVACNRCHAQADAGRPRYRGVPFAECSDCHADVHAGRLGDRCSTCHTTDGFDRRAAGFDHSLTRYPLVGQHAGVECASCHDPQRGWGKRPAFQTCGSCHRDAHAGQAADDCSACHDERGFRPATYTIEHHSQSGFPLEGKHRRVTCAACHTAARGSESAFGPAGVEMRPAHERCRDCHDDAHAGQLEHRRPGGGDCEGCHDVDGWQPSHYGVQQHAELSLALDGRHAEIACASCHALERAGLPAFADPRALGTARVALSVLDSQCSACHLDSHPGRLSDGSCASCHDTTRFRPSAVDAQAHGGFGYPLEGAHRAVPCVACHAELAQPPARSTLVELADTSSPLTFEIENQACSACHDDPHASQFEARTCDACHDGQAFRPATRFDHDRDSRFKLEGAHERVPCQSCHRSTGDTVVYRPVPADCRDCHAGGVGLPGGDS